MKVFVLTSGEYSDYSIEGVFSTKQLAVDFGEWVSGCNDPFEMELDQPPGIRLDGRVPWNVIMDVTGNTKAERASTRHNPFRDDGVFYIHQGRRSFAMTVYATDREHAIKIVNEKRIQLLAENKLNPL